MAEDTSIIPPVAPKHSHRTYPTRWEKEKAAADSVDAFDYPSDPKFIGPWILGETVGKGASGRVKIARHRSTGMLAAVKILPYNLMSSSSSKKVEKHRTSVEREIVLMKLMEHPNIMRLYDVWEGKGNLYLILEWVEGGELFDLIVERGCLPHAQALIYFKQLIYGLSYCHAFSIAHRDLKPENILIHGTSSYYVKIADWGMATFQTPYAQLETSCGSPHYASPEVIRGEPYNGEKADVWSVGVVLYALLVGRLPFDDPDVPRLLSKVRSGYFEIPSRVHADAADLIRKMLVVNPSQRVSMAAILEHPFFKHDTPGIYYIPPPSPSKLQVTFESDKDIDPDIFVSLRVIYGKHATGEAIRKALLSAKPTRAKAFYTLLLKFRERRKETFDDSDPFGPATDLRPYYPSRTRIFALHALSSPAIPSNSLRQNLQRHTHTRTRSSPPRQSPPALIQSRLPVLVVNKRMSKIDKARGNPVESKGTSSDVTLVSKKVRDPHVITQARNVNDEVSADVNDGINQGLTVDDQGETGPKLHQRVATVSSYDDKNVADASNHHSFQQKLNISKRTSDQRTCQFRPSTPHETVVDDPFLPIKVPRLRHPKAQLEMEELVKRMNTLCLQDAEYMRKETLADNDVSDTSAGKDSALSSKLKPKEIGSVSEKENVPIKAFANEFGRKVPNFMFRRGSMPDRCSTNDDSKRSRNDRSLMRKLKFPDLDNSWISAMTTSDAPSYCLQSDGSPTSSTPLLTPIVQEFRGWFSNLFNFKHPVYRIHSFLNCVASKDEVKRLLSMLKINVSEDLFNWNVLKCKVNFGIEKAGSISRSYIKFRIEFQPHKRASSASENSSRNTSGYRLFPLQQSGFTTIITFIPERGSLSSFKAVCEKIQDEWRFDVAQPVDVDVEMGRVRSKEINAMEVENSFMIVQPEI